MRDILFRAKSICADSPRDVSHNYWVEGSLVHQTDHYGDPVNVYHIVKPGNFHCDYYDSEEVWPDTVGEFTGLFDKNGKKIFEGDIIIHCNTYTYKVFWSENEQAFYVEGVNHLDLDRLGNLYGKYCEIIGNIHDNPELLKGE